MQKPQIEPKQIKMYNCAACGFSVRNKKDYNKHLQTNKHNKLMGYNLNQTQTINSVVTPVETPFAAPVNTIVETPVDPPVVTRVNAIVETPVNQIVEIYLCKCGKTYTGRSGLWKHTKSCNVLATCSKILNEMPAVTNLLNNNIIDDNVMNTFVTLVKQNQEFKELMVEQAKQLKDIQKKLKKVSKIKNIICNNNNSNSNNNTTNNSFNLNVFLNETCKDAVNMVDFVKSLRVQLSDLEETGKLGYSNGMSRIFVNGLKDMDVHKRPIHCSDLKRETLYIKEDNVWEKDNEEKDMIKQAIRKIEQKNIQQIPVWVKAHPNCIKSHDRENTRYLTMVMQSTGGLNPDDETNVTKIITTIAKETVISKKCAIDS